MSIKAMLVKGGDGSEDGLLHGSDIPVGTKSITIIVAGIREAPEGFGAPAIIDLKVRAHGKLSWAVNKTNLKAIVDLFGDHEAELVGRKIKLDVVSVRNPQTGEIVPSLRVSPKQ